ncbi:MAG: hypothetical protein ACXVEF_36035 [Polyangiales bacterium]
MRSSETLCALVVALTSALSCSSRARAQEPAQGFRVERFYPSAPGGGWLVMDALDMRGGLGGAMEMTLGYARNAFHVGGGAERLNVVSQQAFAEFGFAATYDRFRFSLSFETPTVINGNSGTVGGFAFTAPSVDPGHRPDSFSDARLGLDTRLLGRPDGPFRVGLGMQLFVPNGSRSDYVTDETYRAMGRALFAGDFGLFTYAGHLGVHVRPLDDSAVPGSPRGSELLFGVAGGAKLALCGHCSTAFVIGPEIYGATAFRSFFGAESTALEGLLSTRIEGTAADGPQLRFKLGVGGALYRHFGAADGRIVFSIELFDRGAKAPR